MTSSDPTRDPAPTEEQIPNGEQTPTEPTTDGVDGPASTELVPRGDGGDLVETDKQGTDQPATDQPGTLDKGKTRPSPPELNRQTRIGAAWVAVAVGVVVLVLLLIFILQNLKPVTVTYFSAHGTMPLGVLLLFAAAGGALLVIILGFARILQMRILARRDRRANQH